MNKIVVRDDQFWNNIDVPMKEVKKLVNASSKKILNYLQTNSNLNREFMQYLVEEYQIDVEHVQRKEFIKKIKEKMPDLLFVLIALREFSQNKSTEFVELFVSKKVKKSKTIDFSNRLWALFALYLEDAEQFQKLYWEYKVWRRSFEEYEVVNLDGSFYSWLANLNKETFESQLANYANVKSTNCHCWYILEEKKSKVFCIRGFPKAIINPGVQKNDEIDRAATLIVRVYLDSRIEIARGSIRSAKKIFTYLLKISKTGKSFKRVINYFPENDFYAFIDSIIKTDQSEGKLKTIAIKHISDLDAQPKIIVSNIDGLNKSLSDLEKKKVEIKKDKQWIDMVELLIDGVTVQLDIARNDNKEVALNCKKARFSEETEYAIAQFCSKNKIKITYGRDIYED